MLTNKYAEGYPGKRCMVAVPVDVAEQLAIDRAKLLFGAEHANVQPHLPEAVRTWPSIFSVLKLATRCSPWDLSHGRTSHPRQSRDFFREIF